MEGIFGFLALKERQEAKDTFTSSTLPKAKQPLKATV